MQDENASNIETSCLRERDADAFVRLVRDNERVVASLARSMGVAGSDLEDAVAETFAEVYRSLPRFEGRSSIKTWVYQIASRTIWRVRESRKRRPHTSLQDDIQDGSQSTPAEQFEISQQSQRLWAAVASLDRRQATAVELFYGQGFSVEEVAEVLACPAGTAKTLLFRARAELRSKLKGRE